ncbi:glutathione S-transferase theta-3-like isoform X3 [Saccopteryx leptura]|uniref:glutathione S-transferase theta-3-like isoform X3 n=1 Tax=Saccopteryx leptura TaxID=249018 RepID=UPI00339CC6D0
MGLELYLDLLSQPCRAVYIFAKKNDIPFELRTVDLLKGQHHSDAFAQVNPLRKVPALKDGDFTLAESVAILLYLSRKYKAPDHWYPQDLQARARVDEYLAWQHTALRSSCTRAMWQKMMCPVILGEQVPPETLASTLAELDWCLQLLEDKFLKDEDFLAGPLISMADLVAITELMHPLHLAPSSHSLSVPAARSLKADPSWPPGASAWRLRWGRTSSRRLTKLS